MKAKQVVLVVTLLALVALGASAHTVAAQDCRPVAACDEIIVVLPTPEPLPFVPNGPTITVWSISGPVMWAVLGANGNFYSVLDENFDPIVTPIEYRDRFNEAIGAIEENVGFSRLTLGPDMSQDPEHYRAYDAITRDEVGSWMEYSDEWCQAFGVCGDTNYIGP